MNNLQKAFGTLIVTIVAIASLTACQTTSAPNIKPTASVMVGSHGH